MSFTPLLLSYFATCLTVTQHYQYKASKRLNPEYYCKEQLVELGWGLSPLLEDHHNLNIDANTGMLKDCTSHLCKKMFGKTLLCILVLCGKYLLNLSNVSLSVIFPKSPPWPPFFLWPANHLSSYYLSYCYNFMVIMLITHILLKVHIANV